MPKSSQKTKAEKKSPAKRTLKTIQKVKKTKPVKSKTEKSWLEYDAKSDEYSVTLRSPINIALIKYWGKAHEKLIIPTNNSLSLTINKAQLCSTTKLTLYTAKSKKTASFVLELNGKIQDTISDRIQRVIDAIRARASETLSKSANHTVGNGKTKLSEIMKKTHIKIESVNNFATAAGLASSASGLACLARCLAVVYGLEESFEGEFSMYARLGSGSACRSLYGGIVEWKRGFS